VIAGMHVSGDSDRQLATSVCPVTLVALTLSLSSFSSIEAASDAQIDHSGAARAWPAAPHHRCDCSERRLMVMLAPEQEPGTRMTSHVHAAGGQSGRVTAGLPGAGAVGRRAARATRGWLLLRPRSRAGWPAVTVAAMPPSRSASCDSWSPVSE
jgi:hypothetical protein